MTYPKLLAMMLLCIPDPPASLLKLYNGAGMSARRSLAQATHHIGDRFQAGGGSGEAHLWSGRAGQEGACRGGGKVCSPLCK